ncbi:hypothetical protein [Gilliamella intestini]|uniref:Uncharacterized protein n=1 Tax=Gilliamella intestini TaxID=1798183 RepID=A0A1C4BAY8_9GAMM|nr:hypothetical protein [Gilliamella intestini]SCC03944.1 hypothetical protein GA0061080_101833 [Gilliamella intestini]
MIISLKTTYACLNSVMHVSVIGAYVIFLLAIIPITIIIDAIWPYGYTHETAIIQILVTFYNAILSFIFKIKNCDYVCSLLVVIFLF